MGCLLKEGEVGSDDDVLFLNRRNAIKERRRRGLGLTIAEDRGSGEVVEVGRDVGSQEMPVVFDDDEDDEEGVRVLVEEW